VLDVDGATVAIVEDFVIGVTALAKNVFNGIRFDFVVVNTTEPVKTSPLEVKLAVMS
jgi:hypothetical protein